MERIRIVVVGLGHRGRHMTKLAARGFDCTDVVGVCDIDRDMWYQKQWDQDKPMAEILPEPAFFLDLEAYRLLYDFKDSNGIRHFYQRTFAKLLEYDEETGNELTKTLETYLLCGYAKNKTASRLHIHRNSLNYRLKKIEEIMGQSLDEGVHLFAYQLASVIHKLLS